MAHQDDQHSLSIVGVSVATGVFMAYLLWGVSCAMYNAAGHGELAVFEVGDDGVSLPIRRRGAGLAFGIAGVATFVSKSFAMLPEMPSVLGFIFRERFWFVIVSALVLGGVALFALLLKRTEAALATPAYKRKKRR